MRKTKLTKYQTEDLTAQISAYISANNPVFPPPATGRDSCRVWLMENAEDIPASFYSNDPEKDAVMIGFVQKTGLDRTADSDFIKNLLLKAKKYTPEQFYSPEYFKTVHIPTVKLGRFMLKESVYKDYELFQYDMPDLSEKVVVPKIGFCTDEVRFPSVYERNMPWMSACPSEINSMKDDMHDAHGRVLTLGLGLGYFPFEVSNMETVESVTVVELSDEVIRLFEQYLLPQYPNRDKIKIIHADAHEYMKTVCDGQFDYCFADIWENQIDGAEHYKRIKPYEKKLPSTEFRYWVKEAIEWFIDQE